MVEKTRTQPGILRQRVTGAISQYRLLRLVLVTILAGALLIIVWSLNKGLDITDESLGLLLLLHPEEYPPHFSMYHLIVRRLTEWMQPTVLTYRWLTLVMIVVTALAFAFGFYRWLCHFFPTEQTRRVKLTLVFPFVLIGLLSSYLLGVRTLEYNTINNALLFSTAGLLLYILSQEPLRGSYPITVVIALFMAGVLLALDLFVKFPSAIIMFGITLLLIIFHRRRRGLLQIALSIGILTLGAVSGLVLYAVAVQPIAELFSKYVAELQLMLDQSYVAGSILRFYSQNVIALGYVLIVHFTPAFLLSFVLARAYLNGWHRKSLRSRYLMLALLVVAVLYTGYKMYDLDLLHSPYFNGFTTFYTYVVIVCLEIVVLMATYRTKSTAPGPIPRPPARRDALPAIGLLVMLPFAGATGTWNVIFLNALFGLAAWFALIMVLGLFIEERTRSRLALAVCILLPACIGAAQITYGVVWQPYLLATALPDQTIALQEPASAVGLRVDPATAEFVTELRATLKQASFREHDYILGLYNVPGLVYLMGGESPGMPQYHQRGDAKNCRALATVDFSKRTVFLLTTKAVAPKTAACMEAAGMRFPEEFDELATIKNPYSLSSYRWRLAEPWLRVFRHKGRE